ncbi:MAG TPA: sialidase family protein [Candidatus Limnocylindrales bacterium]|nr:sialidase family protein [Candidatus Limnocylindrales bacterium]
MYPLLTVAILLAPAAATGASGPELTQISSDPFTNVEGQHRTQVGSSTFQNGTTIFTAFQSGRTVGGGSAGVGYAAYNKRLGTWTNGFVDGLTIHRGDGAYTAVSDVKVGYCLICYNIWLISALVTGGPDGSTAVFTVRSADDGRTFKKPLLAATGQLTKNWLVCQFGGYPSGASPCYLGYTVTNAGNALRMRVSYNGGLSWGPERGTADNASGFAGQPVVQYDGTVVVPYLATNGQLRAFRTTDLGASWGASVLISNAQRHTAAGSLHASALPSAQRDYYGTTYVAWADCRFRGGCAANDIVVSKSTDGATWSTPTRVPIDATTSGVDHFLPAIGVDPTSYTPDTTRIGLTYHYYPQTSCTFSTCQLNVGFISSVDGGGSWSTPVHVAGPMSLSWLPDTTQGRALGDYLSTEVVWSGNAFPVIPVASARTGGQFNQAMSVPTGGLPITGRS